MSNSKKRVCTTTVAHIETQIRVRLSAMLLGSMVIGTSIFASAQNPEQAIQHVDRIPNTAKPELLYWFVFPSELKDQAYVRDPDLICRQ